MQRLGWIVGFVLLASACTHGPVQPGSNSGSTPTTTTDSEGEIQPTTRLAQAMISSAAGGTVQGRVSFEQMPNSAIASYRVDGLSSKKFYQLSVLPGNACEGSANQPGAVLHSFKGNKDGYSESSFRTDKFSVSGKDPLVGQSILVASLGSRKENPVEAIIGCGAIQAATAAEIHPPTEEEAQ